MPSFDVLTREYRGDTPDLTHYGYLCVVDERGKVLYQVGDPDEIVFYRSASKPIQALPVLARGLDERYELTEEECVLFAGSHAGEEVHIKAITSIMKKAHLREGALVMLPTVPAYGPANEKRIRHGLSPRKFYHNCVGKHAALMMVQRELNAPVEDYWRMDAPVQQEVLRTISVVSEFPEDQIKLGVDGCGVPVFAVSVKNAAISLKNMACPELIQDEKLGEAAAKLAPMINKYPYMMRGTGYLCNEINQDANIIAKGGALGMYCLGLKKERLGIAFKLADGTEDSWPIIIREVLKKIGYRNQDTFDMLNRRNDGITRNDNGTEVGRLVPAFEL